MFANAGKCQGYGFYRLWVINGKPTSGVNLPLSKVFFDVQHESQVCIALQSVLNYIGIDHINHIFQHGEQMVVFNSSFFMMIFQDLKEIWKWISLFFYLQNQFGTWLFMLENCTKTVEFRRI